MVVKMNAEAAENAEEEKPEKAKFEISNY